MSRPLTPVSDALSALEGLAPVDATMLPLDKAAGLMLAETLIAVSPQPSACIALRTGVAVCSSDLIGSSSQSPVALAQTPQQVQAGDVLPDCCDAVIDADSIGQVGPLSVVTESVAPGFNVRLTGQDAIMGAPLLKAGDRLTPDALLACRLGGIATVTVRAPVVVVDIEDQVQAEWLRARLLGIGCRFVQSGASGDLALKRAATSAPRLGLLPGDSAWVERRADGSVLVELPWRFDGLIAAFAALVLPAIARLSGADMTMLELPITRKISSAIGFSELVLSRVDDNRLAPLAAGDLTLHAIANAQAFTLIEPSSEGYNTGDLVAATFLAAPFR